MDTKLVLVCGFLLLFTLDIAQAEFLYNRVLPKKSELKSMGLKCVPGRTFIKMQESNQLPGNGRYDGSDDDDSRRSHMRFTTYSNSEQCKMCVCSIEGKDEYCSKRPAMNVNECMKMAEIMSRFNKHEPFDHERVLSYRIRRDLIWHNDEIPYEPHARCKRSHSYYSNSINANDTDIDVASDVTSLIDYANASICFYCVCAVKGDNAGCLPRSPWFCQYYRDLRKPTAMRDRYKTMFQQDRPAHFRQLSWRLRRTMDNGMFDLIDNVGEGQSCKPFVSAYTDCNAENKCTGCHKCSCSAEGQWECKTVMEPCGEDDLDDDHRVLDNTMIDNALDEMLSELKDKEEKVDKNRRVPAPRPKFDSSLIDVIKAKPEKSSIWEDILKEEDELEISKMFERKRRSTEENDPNKTVIFHHTVDELNEDTLKNSNASGVIEAAKQELSPVVSRRSFPLNNSAPLQIQYTSPIQGSHAADNKVDASEIHDDQVDLLVHHKIYEMVGNKTQEARDKDLSKIVVNELKTGESEIIGDKNSPVISNITFTPENDTLTAMAFIAGNLLNKLWNMEKESEDSLETEHMKHEKINGLLDLFKEPLNLRQEMFLKNALQHLSSAIENRNVGNVTLCENIEQLRKKSGIVDEPSNPIMNLTCHSDKDTASTETDKPELDKITSATAALQKITNVLDLIKKFEKTQNLINEVKNKTKQDEQVTKDDLTTLNVFGNIIESLTKLIIPNKKSKKLTKGLKNKKFLMNDQDVKGRFKNLNLTDISLTTKDKIVLDYIKHMQNNPNCLLNKEEEKPMLPNIEGDILLNVAEFFKIKSMSDLLKLVKSDKTKNEMVMRSLITTTDSTTTSQHEADRTTTSIKPITSMENNEKNFETTKEKLKSHLKTILEDLVELQNISGKNKNEKTINIADALPCIYNLLQSRESSSSVTIGTQENKKKDNNPIVKITQVINNLKKELYSPVQTRRTFNDNEVRPKAAVVWERTLKNIDNRLKSTRRSLSSSSPKPVTVDDVKTKIEKMENVGSNTYKSIAYLAEIPPAERLLLIKTLSADTKKYITLLSDLKELLETKTDLPMDDYKTFSEFIENANINVNLNSKVINKVDQLKQKSLDMQKNRLLTKTINLPTIDLGEDKETVKTNSNTVKLTRDQIINQLIKNRMLYYLKMKDGNVDRKTILNLNLAKKILFYLEMGNDNLGRDLFRVFVRQNKISPSRNIVNTTPENRLVEAIESDPIAQVVERRKTPPIPVPLIQFENSKSADREQWLSQEHLLKQLMNVRNM